MEIAVICAHMDDESFLAGTIARYNIEGHNIHVLVLTDSCSAGHIGTSEIITGKYDEFIEAMELLGGYKSHKICDFPDMRLDTVPHVELNKAIESFIDDARPEMVFTHHPGDLNLDHFKVFESTMVAVRPVMGSSVKKVLCYEVPGNVEWGGSVTQPFTPNMYININSTITIKLDAIKAYKSELQYYPHPRSILNVLNLARVRGAAVGLEVAEAFQLVRSIE